MLTKKPLRSIGCSLCLQLGKDGIPVELSQIGQSVDIMTVEAIVNTLYINEVISHDEAKIILTACSGSALPAINDGILRNRVRADIFKNLLLLFA